MAQMSCDHCGQHFPEERVRLLKRSEAGQTERLCRGPGTNQCWELAASQVAPVLEDAEDSVQS